MSHLLKDIAVFFDGSPTGRQVLNVAARLAGEQGAHLIGICADDGNGDGGPPPDTFARGRAIGDVIARNATLSAARLLRAGQCLARAAEICGGRAEFRVAPSRPESTHDTLRHSLYCDLLVVGYPVSPGAPNAWSSSHILQQTGVSLLIIPNDWEAKSIGRRITIAWNGSRQSRRAIADALPLLVAADAVTLLVVDAEQKAEVLGEQPGADMADYLARHGVTVELLTIGSHGSRVAQVIVAESLRCGADLIVFGAYSRTRLSESLLGGVTKTLLSNVPLPLFVAY